MLRKIWALGIVLILCLSMGVSTQNAVEPNNVNQELEWWDVYSRDKNHDGISDLLIWKLQQGEQFYDIGEARVFVRYDHHPTDYDIQRLEDAGIEVTFRAQFIDLIGTTMSRDIIHEVASWDGIVMLDDIGKAVPDMNEAVPNMGVDQVWKNYGLYGEGISIAIVDTGVDNAHVGLDDMDDNPFTNDFKVAAYYDAVQDSLICSPCQPGESLDSGTHGSHVAGIAAGTGAGETAPDGNPYIGVAPKAHLVNVLSCCEGDIEDIIRGIEWTIENQKVIQPNIRVMTSSLGEQQVEFHIDNDGSSAWSQVSDAAVESGLVVTLSAGNEFGAATVMGCNTIDSPGDSRLPITVASLDKDLNLAVYSSRGYTSDGRVKPDVAAIGSDIWAPNKGTVTGYTSKSGTSMATPLMAGIVALTLEANPDLTPAEVKDTLVAGYSIEREILNDGGLVTNDCSLVETRPDNEYGYGQADPLIFVEIAGMIDPDISVNWTLAYVESEVNGTIVLEKPEIYNGTILKGTAVTANKPTVGVQVKFGASEWYPATDTSNLKNWATWEISIPEEVSKGNQTLAARLVLDGGTSMSAVNSFSVILLDEYDFVNLISQGLTNIRGLFFLPFIIIAIGMTWYIFRQNRKSESNVEVEASGDDDFVWDDTVSDQLSLTTSWTARAISLCALYTAQGIPSGFISFTLIAFLAERGYSAAAIGNMLFWVYLPWVFKFLWGPYVDTYHYLPMGRRRPWILGAQTGMVLTVFIIVFVPDIENKVFLLTGLLFCHNLFASLQDVAVDGLAVDILSPEEFGKINGFMFGAKRFGTMIGGAGIGYFIGSLGVQGGLFLMVPMLLMIMCLPIFIRERPGEKLFPWGEGKAVIKEKTEEPKKKNVAKIRTAGKIKEMAYSSDHGRAILVDLAIMGFLFFFLLLTIGDVLSTTYVTLITLIFGALWYFVFYAKPREEWNSFGVQFYDLAPVQSDIVKALSLKAPLIGILLAMLTYFWEFLIPVLSVLFIQDLGWSDTEYVLVTGGWAVTAGIAGTLAGGFIADKYGARRIASLFAILTGLSIFTIALAEPLWDNKRVMWWLIVIYPFFGAAMGISLISLFMNVTWPKVGATQFTLYMAMLNFGALFGLKMAGYFEENFTYTTTIMIGGTCQLLIAFVLPFIDPGQTRRELGNDF
jgi:subtilisin family serine protease/MFS family permease|tara:strand:+ start:896 stop:4390 length:3495 start_codon:yes stop_codon:yes gene_type:complete